MRAKFFVDPLCLLTLLILPITASVNGQDMPREDVVHDVAIRKGLCVSNVFQSAMVLQRDKPIRVWGWATPGEQITVEFAGEKKSTTTDPDRKWRLELPPQPANRQPQRMVIQSASNTLVLEDILIGDVWVLGGQSNMEFELAKVENGPLEIVSANFPEMRILTVPYGEGPEAVDSFPRLYEWSDWFGRHFRKGYWEPCTPDVARELSAIGYVFARRVHQASGIPIGVIDASRGGTTVEAWTPLPTLRQLNIPVVDDKLETFDRSVAEWDPQADLAKRVEQHAQWLAKQVEEGTDIPADRRAVPDDLRPGPKADQNFPGNCYAGMIAPLAELSVKGVIFHQGYNNAFDGSVGVDLYREVFPVMIKAWRHAFNDPQLPFGILSLCTDGDPQTRDDYCEKMFNAGIGIRAAQYETFLQLLNGGDENIGFASTYDLRRRWYHPQLKIPAGERIARWALATEYGFERQLAWKPPMLQQMVVQDGSIVLQLDTEVGDPEDGKIEGFAIAGEDRVFHPADVAYAERGTNDRGQVQFDRKQLVLTSPMVPSPVHFRYAWGRNPLANLQATGHKDLPFATQKSDDWRMEAVPLRVLRDDTSLPLSRADRNKILQALRDQDRSRRLQEARTTLELLGEGGTASRR